MGKNRAVVRTRRSVADDPTRTARVVVALCAVLASGGCIAASLLSWLILPDGAGATTSVSGWGAIRGGSQIAGENINDALNGNATFRPGVLAVMIGTVALLAAVSMAVFSAGPKPMRIPAAVLTLCGLGGLIWGIVRGTAPDSLGLLDPGVGGSGAGPWLTASCSAILAGVAVVVFTGLLDPPPTASRPRRKRA